MNARYPRLAHDAAAEAGETAKAAATLQKDDSDGTSGGMDGIWKKLGEHDRRFDRIEAQLTDVSKELSNAKFWFVGTALGLGLASLGLVYSARQDTTATIGAALSAIQTVISHKQSEAAPPAPPTVIIVPSGALQTSYPPKLPDPPKQ